MPQRKTLPTEEQNKAIDAYCAKHGLSPTVAGRIAWARLLAKPPKAWEIEDAKVPRGNLDTLKQYQSDDDDENG